MSPNLLILFSVLAPVVGAYAVWFRRDNIPTHMSIGFVVISCLSLFILDMPSKSPVSVVELYCDVHLIGSAVYLVGLLMGAQFTFKLDKKPYSFDQMNEAKFIQYLSNITRPMMALGILAIVASYIGMGFVPMFAADPFAAKFFRGPYQAPYQNYALFYRIGQNIVTPILPLCFALLLLRRRTTDLILTAAGAACMIVSFQRGPMAAGFLSVGFIWAVVARQAKSIWAPYISHMLLDVVGDSLIG